MNPPLQPLLGIAVILALAWALSEDRRGLRREQNREVHCDRPVTPALPALAEW